MGITFLQIFLLINVFIIGVLSATAVRHAWAHFHPHTTKPEKPTVQPVRLSPELREQLITKAQANFKTVMERSTTELQTSLSETTAELNKQLEKIVKDVIDSETNRYHTTLEALRTQAETVITTAQSDLKDHQSDLKEKITESMAAEKQRLITQIDTKLGDAVSSFLTETLGHDVDLGAQMPYMLAALETHKEELIKGISDDQE